MENQTEFVFLVFKVKQDEASQDDILSKLAFSFSATTASYRFYQMHVQLCHLDSSVDLYLGIHLVNHRYRGLRV